MSNTTPRRKPIDPPGTYYEDEPIVNDAAVLAIPMATTHFNDATTSTLQTEPSNRELLNMLLDIKTDVDDIKTTLATSPNVGNSNEGLPAENVSPADLIRITERWDEANPKEPAPRRRREPVFILQEIKSPKSTNESQSTCIATVASPPSVSTNVKLEDMGFQKNSSPFSTQGDLPIREKLVARHAQLRAATSPSKQSGAKLVAKRLPTISETTTLEDKPPLDSTNAFLTGASDHNLMTVSNTKPDETVFQKSSPPFDTQGGSAFRAKLLARNAHLRAATSPSKQSGAVLVAKRRAAPTIVTTTLEDTAPLDSTVAFLVGSSDHDLMLLYHAIRHERRSRLNEAMAADCQERIHVLGKKDSHQSTSAKKQKQKSNK
jgi:hypothetical protein